MKKIFTLILNKTAYVLPKWNGKLAFQLLCKVKRIEISSQGNDFLNKAVQSKWSYHDYEATIYKYGSGSKKLIFLHGWLSNSERWREMIESIDLRDYSCYLIDAPGHGRSKGNSLNLEIYRLILIDLVKSQGDIHSIIGHSLGSLVTAYALMRDATLPVDSIILTGAPAGMNSIYDFFKRIMNLNNKTIENMDAFINEEITEIPAHEINIKNFLKVVQQPVLVIHDYDDKICPIVPIETAVALNKQVESFFTSHLGHDLLDREVIKRTLHFLDSV